MEEFKDYYENKHLPMARSLIGDRFPKSHVRNYISRDAKNEPRILRGQPSDMVWDAIVILTFTDEEHFNKFVAIFGDEEIAKKLADDEDNFTDRSSLRMVVLGDVRTTET